MMSLIIQMYLMHRMQRILSILSITSLFIFIVANKPDNSKKSKVLYVKFVGNGESGAYLYGKVRYFNGKDTVALDSVEISVFDQKSKMDTAIHTDSLGNWEFESGYGVFNFLIRKIGFQSLRVDKYQSISDRETEINILLEKGTETQSYTISGKIYK